MELFFTIVATVVVSLGGLLGIISLRVPQKALKSWLKSIIAMAAGVMMGVSFLDLFPEAAHHLDSEVLFSIILLGFIGFFLIEKLLLWRHCHEDTCDTHAFGYINLIGDGIHNLVDGVLIGSAFNVSTHLGVLTAIAVALHEIPQEISDFSVLLYSGFSRAKALILNFLVASMAIVGGIIGSVASDFFDGFQPYLLVVAGSSFLYIAASDLIPELRKVTNRKQIIQGFGLFILGVLMIFVLELLVGHPEESPAIMLEHVARQLEQPASL